MKTFIVLLLFPVGLWAEKKDQAPQLPLKDLGLAVLFSLAAPGAGQVYNEEFGKAAAVFGASVTGVFLAAIAAEEEREVRRSEDDESVAGAKFLVGAALVVSSYAWSVRDAYGSAKQINERRKLQSRRVTVEPAIVARAPGARVQWRF